MFTQVLVSEAVLEWSHVEHRILLTEDWDFGDLVVRA